MRFMGLMRMPENVGPPPAALIEAMGKSLEEQFRTGKITDAGGLMPNATIARVTSNELVVTDGPYAEGTEVVGGYSILNVDTLEEAQAMARQVVQLHLDYWPGWEGACELREISSGPPEAG